MAKVTASQITAVTTPDGFTANPVGSQLFSGYDGDASTSPGTLVSGTVTTDDNNAADTVEVRCYYGGGSSSYYTFESVPVNADGTFAMTTPYTNNEMTCRLAAVDPSYSNPVDPTTYKGPVYGVGYHSNYTVGSGPNSSSVYDFFNEPQQAKAYQEWYSSGDGGLYWFVPLSNSFYGYSSYSPWYYAGAYYTSGSGDGFGRSEIQVDGRNALNSYGAYVLNSDGNGHSSADNGNFPGMTTSSSVDPATGDTTIKESEKLVHCGSAAFPATAQCDAADNTNQASFKDTGVRFDRVVTTSKEGLMATVTDTFTSTDGAQHSIDVELDNYSYMYDYALYKFPGSSGYHYYYYGDNVDLPAQSVGTIFAKDDEYQTGPDGSVPGSLTYLQQPDRAFFNANYSQFALQYKRTVPAGGSVSLTHVYTAAMDDDQVAALAAAAEDAATAPTVAITSPADNSATASAEALVTGTAAGQNGTPSLSVNGIPTPVQPDGTWSQRVPLASGPNTITAVAKNSAGNTGQAAITVNYSPAPGQCVVPNVVGKTTAEAIAAVQAANCQVGSQSAANSPTVKAGSVIRQGIPAGISAQNGTPIDLTISLGKFSGASLASKTAKLKGRSLVLAVRCGSTAIQTGTVKIRTASGKKKVTLGTAAFSCPKGKKRTVKFTIGKATARKLHRSGKTRANVFIVSRNSTGDSAQRTGKLTIKG